MNLSIKHIRGDLERGGGTRAHLMDGLLVSTNITSLFDYPQSKPVCVPSSRMFKPDKKNEITSSMADTQSECISPVSIVRKLTMPSGIHFCCILTCPPCMITVLCLLSFFSCWKPKHTSWLQWPLGIPYHLRIPVYFMFPVPLEHIASSSYSSVLLCIPWLLCTPNNPVLFTDF